MKHVNFATSDGVNLGAYAPDPIPKGKGKRAPAAKANPAATADVANAQAAKHARNERTINSWLSGLTDLELENLKGTNPDYYARAQAIRQSQAAKAAQQQAPRQPQQERPPINYQERAAEQARGRAAAKQQVQAEQAIGEERELRRKFTSNPQTNPVGKVFNRAANVAIDTGAKTPGQVYGRIAAGVLIPSVAVGTGIAAVKNYRRANAEKDINEQQAAYANDLIARRDEIIASRRAGTATTPGVNEVNDFTSPEIKLAEYKLGFRSPVKLQSPIFNDEPAGIPWKKVGLAALGGYGLLSGLEQKRAQDAIRAAKIKDKDEKEQALNYLNSPRYNIDTLINQAGIPIPKAEALLSADSETADFFLPLLAVAAPVMGIAGGAYGLYRRKVEAKKKDEILEAEKLAALNSIKDRKLRDTLIQRERGQAIDDRTKNKIIDSVLGGDPRTALSVGLKNLQLSAPLKTFANFAQQPQVVTTEQEPAEESRTRRFVRGAKKFGGAVGLGLVVRETDDGIRQGIRAAGEKLAPVVETVFDEPLTTKAARVGGMIPEYYNRVREGLGV